MSPEINFQTDTYTVYTGLFSPRVISVLLNLQTVSPRLKFAQTLLLFESCLKRDIWRH